MPRRLPPGYRGLWHPTAAGRAVSKLGLGPVTWRPPSLPVGSYQRVVTGIPLVGGQASTVISAGPSTGSAALVQAKAGNTATGTSGTLTITLNNPTGAGNCLVVYFGSSQGTLNPTVSGITLGGAAGNFASAKSLNNNAGVNCEIWVDWNCAGGQTSVAISFAGGSGAGGADAAWVEEWSGILATASPVDTPTANGAFGNSAAPSSGSTGTLSQAPELVLGAICGGNTLAGPASPWVNEALSSSGTLSVIAGHQAVTTTAAQTYAGTMTSGGWTAVIVSLKLAPATGGSALPAGQALTSVGPQGLGNVWYPAQATISTTSGINDNSTFSLYLGPAGVPVTLVGQAFPGGTGTLAVAVPSMTPGQYLIGLWTGGNPGDVASINVIGTMDSLMPG